MLESQSVKRDHKVFTDYKHQTLLSVESVVHPSFRKFQKAVDGAQL